MQLTWKTGEWKDAESRQLKFGIKKSFQKTFLVLSLSSYRLICVYYKSWQSAICLLKSWTGDISLCLSVKWKLYNSTEQPEVDGFVLKG